MTDPFPRAKIAIVGAATCGVGKNPGFEASDLAALACKAALKEAGLRLADIDGLFFCHPTDTMGGLSFAQYLGVQPKVVENNRIGGASFQNYIELASYLLAAGAIDAALIAYGSNQASAAGKLVNSVRPMIYEAPYAPLSPVSSYALAAARYIYEFGATKEQFGAVALAARAWAQLNPEAYRREPLAMAEYMSSRLVSDPLSVLDCCLVTDGAGALVLTRADRARDLATKPVYVLGGATETTHREIAWMPDLTVTGAARAGARAYAQARVTPQDIDVVEIYDAFTINTLLALEDLGFCAKGEAGPFVQDGAIAPGGSLPVNTHGGGLSCVHPGMNGIFTLIEAVRQLRAEAGARQVSGASLAIAHGNGGVLSSQAVVILGAAQTV